METKSVCGTTCNFIKDKRVIADHLEYAFTTPNKVIFNAKRSLKNVEFDSIAFCGMSGALVAPMLAREMGKRLILVRKDYDDTHSDYGVEGIFEPGDKFIIVDDFISSGKTVKRILQRIYDLTIKEQFKLVCAGIYEYNKDLFSDPGRLKNEAGISTTGSALHEETERRRLVPV